MNNIIDIFKNLSISDVKKISDDEIDNLCNTIQSIKIIDNSDAHKNNTETQNVCNNINISEDELCKMFNTISINDAKEQFSFHLNRFLLLLNKQRCYDNSFTQYIPYYGEC